MGQGPPGVAGGAGGLPSLDGAAFADNLRRGSAVDPRCGGRGRDQEAIMRTLFPTLVGFTKSRVQQGPADLPETPAEIKGGLSHSRPAAA